ncbi:DUF2786 domain-containing protein [Salmonella enterica]|uniref:DUF2786 domain-containing protein n=1 Tax=Salmonella enterica TaxID=28901 RepID=UPI0012D6C9BE|nr:DUF2786 domain-containing protein [Salmonella enterica]EBQ9003656.1 DUF2786 domain-containing protein [Salmonella enterica subsp. enterica serovar Blockley]ECD6162198.1 DUF2786 domain-containing protein [Salmonella enterica subsp. enterica]ECU7995390.1 DUF2786 domain-containing protein [Salmonella enterica subsp. enterica serovar Toucra]EAW3045238.1 DUF2786 domain-containing protein [Salmonella enterica]
MDENKDKVIRRLKKLMALTGSSNANEASAALARAQKLMETHGVTQDDIEILDINESICDYWPVGASNPPRYMAYLLQVIKDAFGVDCILLGGCGVSFYGLYNRPQLAGYTFEVLGRQLIKARRDFIKTQNKRIKTSTKTARGDKFAEGWIIAVLNKIEKLARTAHEVELAERWLEKKYTRTVTRNARESGKTRDNDNARNSGYLEGRQACLHQPVNGQEQAKLGVSS